MLLLPNTPGNRMLAVAFRGVDDILDATSRSLDKIGLKQSVKKAMRTVRGMLK